MAKIPAPLEPAAGEQGLATDDPQSVAAWALEAWDYLLSTAEASDLRAPARAHGWTGGQVLLPFGDWPENRGLDQILDDARAGMTGAVDQADDVRRVQLAHGNAPIEQQLDACRRSRDQLAQWIDDGGPLTEGLLPTRSLLGTLPVLTLVHATAFQLAVSARDLEPCGAVAPPQLLDIGMVALLDTTGALAARQRATASFTVRTPERFVGTGSRDGHWRTVDLGDLSEPLGPGISATAAVALDIASGRANVPSLYASGAVAVTDMTGLLALAPIIEGVPGIPAGAALARAARVMSGLGGLLGGLFGRARFPASHVRH